MACMEHECHNCRYIANNNDPGPLQCPHCGRIMSRLCDEYGDDVYSDDDMKEEDFNL